MSTPHRTVTFKGMTATVTRKATKFVAFYVAIPGCEYAGQHLTTEHKTEAAAAKGSWQSAGMRQIWAHVGYVEVS